MYHTSYLYDVSLCVTLLQIKNESKKKKEEFTSLLSTSFFFIVKRKFFQLSSLKNGVSKK